MSGWPARPVLLDCPVCDGAGEVVAIPYDPTRQAPVRITCPVCLARPLRLVEPHVTSTLTAAPPAVTAPPPATVCAACEGRGVIPVGPVDYNAVHSVDCPSCGGLAVRRDRCLLHDELTAVDCCAARVCLQCDPDLRHEPNRDGWEHPRGYCPDLPTLEEVQAG